MEVWHNGDILDYNLVNCFDGFFVQVTVSCCRTLLDNILAAAPIIVPQLQVDPLVLPDSQFLQVTAHVPGGDTLISSRFASLVDRRDRVYAVLHTRLRQRFPDMLHVGFETTLTKFYGKMQLYSYASVSHLMKRKVRSTL